MRVLKAVGNVVAGLFAIPLSAFGYGMMGIGLVMDYPSQIATAVILVIFARMAAH